MAKEAYHGPLEKVSDCCYRIPKSYRPDMRVDGLIFADENLIEAIKNDQAPDQVANVATLPGIQMASLAMPDIHWGYGFCIGGVCATDPDEGGVISPGGVGYDINCLAGDAKVLHHHGYTRPIGEMAGEWHRAELACYSLRVSQPTSTPVQRWFGQKPRKPVLHLRTASGEEVRATADHPFWTPDGMKPLGRLKTGDRVAMSPFAGVPYEAPRDDVILSEEAFRQHWLTLGRSTDGHALEQAVNFLKGRNLLPLKFSSAATPYLCKLLGFIFGDGSIHFETGERERGIVTFYGDAEDLFAIRKDLQAIGLTASKVYVREREHHIRTTYAEYSFDRQEHWCKAMSTAFAVLLTALGAPAGKKVAQSYALPAWLKAAPRWQHRLFLAALFGAELSAPVTVPKHGTVFAAPQLYMNKRPGHVDSGQSFLQELSELLAGFEVKTQAISQRNEQVNANGERSVRLQLILCSDTQSLLNLWGRVGYEYNRKRSGAAALAVQYLKHKQRLVTSRQAAAERAVAMAAEGHGLTAIVKELHAAGVNRRFVERALYGGHATLPRVGTKFPTFAKYVEEATAGLARAGMVWEKVLAITPAMDFDGEVYDFTVAHEDHNFIANGFVVSNCGVRLMRSNLYFKDVQPRLKQLVEELFREVPTGVGKTGKYRFDRKELKALMTDGSRYLIKRGLATQGDIDHTEAEGRLDGADPDLVSDRAMERGAEQCGTLGSGNHFLEIQVVDQIWDEPAAAAMGLAKDMICVLVHSGSRGLGYQVCDDALMSLRGVPEKYGIALPDRQLACAPVHSSEGQRYIKTMRAAANFAWCNRQLLMWQAREVFETVFGKPWTALQMNLIYDVCHNIAKFEEHEVNGVTKKVWVHRKGATRAFPPGHQEVPSMYRKIGQPVIIPGDMGRASWVLVGQPGSMAQTFGTTCHGAGRAMSRTAAVKAAQGRRIDRELESKGIIARARSWKGLAEEQPSAYKNVDEVVEVVHNAGISKKVARMRPIGVIKG